MSSAASTFGACAERDRLFAQFKRALDHYHQTLLGHLAKTGTEDAVVVTQALHQTATAAREALQKHEREHGCFRSPTDNK